MSLDVLRAVTADAFSGSVVLDRHIKQLETATATPAAIRDINVGEETNLNPASEGKFLATEFGFAVTFAKFDRLGARRSANFDLTVDSLVTPSCSASLLGGNLDLSVLVNCAPSLVVVVVSALESSNVRITTGRAPSGSLASACSGGSLAGSSSFLVAVVVFSHGLFVVFTASLFGVFASRTETSGTLVLGALFGRFPSTALHTALFDEQDAVRARDGFDFAARVAERVGPPLFLVVVLGCAIRVTFAVRSLDDDDVGTPTVSKNLRAGFLVIRSDHPALGDRQIFGLASTELCNIAFVVQGFA